VAGEEYLLEDLVFVKPAKGELDNRRKIVQDGIDRLFWIAKIMEVRAVDDKHVYARVW
jgi:hypothetical protein